MVVVIHELPLLDLFFMSKIRFYITLSLLILIPVGIWSKFYTGFGHQWFNNYAGDILYNIFWSLFIFLLIPRKKTIIYAPLLVFFISCFLEILQLIQTPLLIYIRSFLLGQLLIGTTFSWWDFIYYFWGCLISWFWLRSLWLFL